MHWVGNRVQAFLEAGAHVAVNGRTAQSTVAAVAALGDIERVLAAPGDIATVASCEAVVGRTTSSATAICSRNCSVSARCLAARWCVR